MTPGADCTTFEISRFAPGVISISSVPIRRIDTGDSGRRRERRNRHDDFRQRYLHRVEGDVYHGGVRCRDQERFGGDRVESFGGDIQCVVSHRDAADQEQPVAVRRSRESVAREPHGDACDRPVVAAAGHAALDGAVFGIGFVWA